MDREDQSTAATRWRLKYGDAVFGPYDRRELEALLADGRLDRTSLLAAEGQGEDWRPAAAIPELADLFATAAAPAKARPPRIAGNTPDTTWLHAIYALYAASFFSGLTAVIGVVLAYVKRPDAAGSWQDSHYVWLIRTFWIALFFMVIGGITTFIGIGFLIMFLAGLWLIYRIVKGWLRLGQLRAVENPTDYF